MQTSDLLLEYVDLHGRFGFSQDYWVIYNSKGEFMSEDGFTNEIESIFPSIGYGPIPVSYTHLTLPTNDLV